MKALDRSAPELTGSRIRQRRLEVGMKQADLARRVRISPSYLNLIEHNRRKIGGALMVALAEALEVPAEALSEGPEASVVQELLAVAAVAGDRPERDRASELVARLPGWASAFIAQGARIAELEETVAALSDRLSHNPHLAASLHDLISTVTAIQSSAAILSETPDIEPQWQARFQRNIFEDSARLVEGAGRLTAVLGPDAGEADLPGTPKEAFEAFLDHNGHHFPALERGLATPAELVEQSPGLTSRSAKAMALKFLDRYVAEAARLPGAALKAAIAEVGSDPGRIAGHLGLPLALVLRRIACQPQSGAPGDGLAIADGSGALVYARPAHGFAMPRLGHGCPLWPLYQALTRPGAPVRALIELPGATPLRFEAFAIADLTPAGAFGGPTVAEATMLVRPVTVDARAADPVGPDCPICPREQCPARRVPSILAHGL